MRKSVISNCITQKKWFERFVRGVDLLVGSTSRLDQDISTEFMKVLMDKVEAAVKRDGSILERRDLTKKGDHFMSCFVASSRGVKGFIMDAAVLRHPVGKVR